MWRSVLSGFAFTYLERAHYLHTMKDKAPIYDLEEPNDWQFAQRWRPAPGKSTLTSRLPTPSGPPAAQLNRSAQPIQRRTRAPQSPPASLELIPGGLYPAVSPPTAVVQFKSADAATPTKGAPDQQQLPNDVAVDEPQAAAEDFTSLGVDVGECDAVFERVGQWDRSELDGLGADRGPAKDEDAARVSSSQPRSKAGDDKDAAAEDDDDKDASAKDPDDKDASATAKSPATANGSSALVQNKGARGSHPQHTRQLAQRGLADGGSSLPYLHRLQRAFGRHDISGVRAHTGGAARAANRQMGSVAYATGDDVAFGAAPDLHTAAHEAAHVVQQRHGVSLSSGVGSEGDAYERHADRVADAVVAGGSAEAILDEIATGSRGRDAAVQYKLDTNGPGLPPAQAYRPLPPLLADKAVPHVTPEQLADVQLAGVMLNGSLLADIGQLDTEWAALKTQFDGSNARIGAALSNALDQKVELTGTLRTMFGGIRAAIRKADSAYSKLRRVASKMKFSNSFAQLSAGMETKLEATERLETDTTKKKALEDAHKKNATTAKGIADDIFAVLKSLTAGKPTDGIMEILGTLEKRAIKKNIDHYHAHESAAAVAALKRSIADATARISRADSTIITALQEALTPLREEAMDLDEDANKGLREAKVQFRLGVTAFSELEGTDNQAIRAVFDAVAQHSHVGEPGRAVRASASAINNTLTGLPFDPDSLVLGLETDEVAARRALQTEIDGDPASDTAKAARAQFDAWLGANHALKNWAHRCRVWLTMTRVPVTDMLRFSSGPHMRPMRTAIDTINKKMMGGLPVPPIPWQ